MTRSDIERRSLLQAAAALASGAMAGPARAQAPQLQSKPGDFEFLAGEWRIHHRRLKAPGDWDVFEGEATCWNILNGVGSVEELRVPSRQFIGMGLRLLDVAGGRWSDYWVPGWSGLLTPPPTWGGFVDGAGVFIADDVDGETPIRIRGLWDGITATSCRWSQAISRDGGATWDDNWLMEWSRVPART